IAHSCVDDKAQVPPLITRETSSAPAPVIRDGLVVDAFVFENQNASTAAAVTITNTVIARAATSTVPNQPPTDSVRPFRSASIRVRNRELIKGEDTIRSTSA